MQNFIIYSFFSLNQAIYDWEVDKRVSFARITLTKPSGQLTCVWRISCEFIAKILPKHLSFWPRSPKLVNCSPCLVCMLYVLADLSLTLGLWLLWISSSLLFSDSFIVWCFILTLQILADPCICMHFCILQHSLAWISWVFCMHLLTGSSWFMAHLHILFFLLWVPGCRMYY